MTPQRLFLDILRGLVPGHPTYSDPCLFKSPVQNGADQCVHSALLIYGFPRADRKQYRYLLGKNCCISGSLKFKRVLFNCTIFSAVAYTQNVYHINIRNGAYNSNYLNVFSLIFETQISTPT